MTAHKLAELLLKQKDLPVVINGWSCDEGFRFEVEEIDEQESSFRSVEPHEKDALGYELPRPCLELGYTESQRKI